MKRVLALLFALAVLAAACGDDDDTGSTVAPSTSPTTSSTTSTTTTSTTTTTTSTTTTTTTTTTTLPPTSSTPLDLAPSSVESTDPLETIEPLDGVSLTMTSDGQVGLTFDEVLYGDPGYRLLGTPDDLFAGCSSYESDDGPLAECIFQDAEGFGGEQLPNPELFPPMTAWLPGLVLTEDSISITFDGRTFVGDALVIEDGPVMVAINPDGTLRDPVTRRTGEITAAELYAAMNA